ncbi:MAG TPA: type II toxin-antitoxin system HicB family antitoxin [Gelria sp.]|nr:type II toxin-antitoxin system HicB family antitoxin [Gelria sp.]
MKKNLSYYLDLNYDIKIRRLTEEEGGGWFAEIPLLPGCISDGETVEQLLVNIEDAKKCWFESCLESGRSIPEPQEDAYSGQLRVRLPKSLHKTLTEKAREENTSLNQYIVYQLARGVGHSIK